MVTWWNVEKVNDVHCVVFPSLDFCLTELKLLSSCESFDTEEAAGLSIATLTVLASPLAITFMLGKCLQRGMATTAQGGKLT
jgi:hypothetical protein